jgi:hypothetical protein
MPIYELNYQLASLDPPALEMYQFLRGNQAETNRFFGIMAGTVPVLHHSPTPPQEAPAL